MTGGLPAVTTITENDAMTRFAVGLKEIHKRMFEGCFSIMNRGLQFNICELEDSFQLNKDVPDLADRISKHITEALRYAVSFWLSHLEYSDVNAKKTAEKVLTFLDSAKGLYWIEALSLMEAIDRGVVLLQECARLFAVRTSACVVMRKLTNTRPNRASWR